jgi:NodT family efflux transporter outer membrane factor (OMF) lipoprotein
VSAFSSGNPGGTVLWVAGLKSVLPRLFSWLLPPLAWLAGGCAGVPREPAGPPLELPGAFSRAGGGGEASAWWRQLGSPALVAEVERAQAENFSLKAAADRVARADALAREARAALAPELSGRGSARTEERRSADGSRDSSGGGLLALAASYEIDLWGRLRAGRTAALAEADVARADRAAAAQSLAASVCILWFQRAEQAAQLEVLARQQEANRQGLELVKSRNRRGQAGAADVLEQEQLVEANQGEIELASARLATLDNALAVLTARPPGSHRFATGTALPAPPAPPRSGVPAEWALGRPDLQAAAFALAAADARLAAAVADRFPRISLSGLLSSPASTWGGLFEAWLAELAGEFSAPLVDGGARRARIAAADARRGEALNLWGQAVLEALREVEDALVRENRQRAYVASLERQIELANQAVERVRAEWLRGNESYLRVLVAVRSAQTLELRLLAARRQLVEDWVSLCRSLARNE